MAFVFSRITVVAAAVVAFVVIAAFSAPAAGFLVGVGLFLVLPAVSYLDAASVPVDSWKSAGRSRGPWMVSFFVIPLGISLVSTLAYWTWLRRRLPGGSLRAGEQVEITAGLHVGRRATLTRRRALGIGGMWFATVGSGNESTTVPVSSSTVRRRGDVVDADFEALGEAGPSTKPPRRQRSIRNRLAGLGMTVVVCGATIVALGVGDDSGMGPVLIAFGAVAIAMGLFVAVHSLMRFNRRRRLPERLRSTYAQSRDPVSLEFEDGRRIVATGVLPGGYVMPRRTDPPFNAEDAVAIQPATTREIDDERRRQAEPA